MSYITVSKAAYVKDYSASVKGPTAIVKIEIVVRDPHELAYLLQDLGQMKRDGAKKAGRPVIEGGDA